MILDKKHGYLLQWLIGVGDLIVLNLLFVAVCHLLPPVYTEAISYNVREVLLLLNFCYFFSLYFVPLRLHLAVVFIDKIVQRAFGLVTVMMLLFATCLIFLNVGDVLATFLLVYYGCTIVVFSLWRVVVRLSLKLYRRKGYNFKKVVIVGAGKNGMELYQVMKDDLSYGFNVMGFFDDNESLRRVLPNYLGKTDEVEDYVERNDVDEIYCTLPGTNGGKIVVFGGGEPSDRHGRAHIADVEIWRCNGVAGDTAEVYAHSRGGRRHRRYRKLRKALGGICPFAQRF